MEGVPHTWDSPEYGPSLYCQYPQPSDSDSVTAQTTAIMAQLVRGDLTLAWFQNLARAIAGDGTPSTQLDRIFGWVKSHVRYVKDASGPWSKTKELDEVLTGPAKLVTCNAPADDCDGFAMLTAALAIANGIPTQFKTIAADAAAPDSFSHVYAVAFTRDGPYPLDTSNGPAPKWEYPRATRAKLWPITGAHYMRQRRANRLSGLGDSGDSYANLNFFPGAGTASTPTYTAPSSGSDIDWNKVISQGFGVAAPILKAQYGTPQLAPGTFYSTSPTGATTMYAVPQGQSLSLPGTAAAISSTSLLLVGGAAILLVILLSSRGH